jgi:flagellar motor switch protein FliG
MPATLTGTQKAAVLLMQMGPERSASVLRRVSDSEVERLTAEIAQLRQVDGGLVDEVLDEFHTLAKTREFCVQGGVEFARQVLQASVGEQKAQEILDRLSVTLVSVPFDFLRKADARRS